MQGTAQIENLVKKAKNYTIISTYMNIKRKNLVCAMNDGMRTILQVIKCRGFRRAVGVMLLSYKHYLRKKR